MHPFLTVRRGIERFRRARLARAAAARPAPSAVATPANDLAAPAGHHQGPVPAALAPPRPPSGMTSVLAASSAWSSGGSRDPLATPSGSDVASSCESSLALCHDALPNNATRAGCSERACSGRDHWQMDAARPFQEQHMGERGLAGGQRRAGSGRDEHRAVAGTGQAPRELVVDAWARASSSGAQGSSGSARAPAAHRGAAGRTGARGQVIALFWVASVHSLAVVYSRARDRTAVGQTSDRSMTADSPDMGAVL